jgi:hypothetical protein
MSGVDRSQTDLEVLRSSHRGKFILLGAVLAAGAGVWWWTHREGPIGNREEADRVLVVTQTGWRYKPYLEGWGFAAQEGRAQTMEDEAREKMPDLQVTGAPAILKLADWAGYGYVVFENPGKVDFAGLEVEGGLPSFEPWHRFAVVSAGDLAFPHRLTVNARPSEVLRGPEFDLLSALFQQEPLAGTLRDDPKNTPEVMVLKGKLSEGIERLNDVKDAEGLVAKISEKARALLVDKEQGDPKPALLGQIHESLNAIALADGGTLVMSRQVKFSAATGYNADLELGNTWEFSYLPAGAEPGAERTPCTSLMGGSLEESGKRPNFRFSPQGDVVLVHVDGASQVWKLDPGADRKTCNFVHLGNIGVPLVRGEDPGEPHVSGQVARVRGDGADAVLSVVKPGEELAVELLRSQAIGLRMPAWVDAEWVVVPGFPGGDDEAPEALYFASPAHPDQVLKLDALALDASTVIHQVAPAPAGPNGPRILVTASKDGSQRLFRLDAPGPLAALFADALAAGEKAGKPQAVVDGVEPWVLPLDGASFTATVLTREGWVEDPVAAADGSAVVFQVRDIDNGILDADSRREIAVVGLDGQSPLRLLTRNGLEDHTPMFSADGKTVVFRTLFPFEKTNWKLTTARSVPARK